MSRPRTSEKTRHFTESVIREMTRLALAHGAVNLSQGFPDFPAPASIKDAACDAIRADINQYDRVELGRYLGYRIGYMQSKGMVPNYEASVAKIFSTELGQRLYNFGVNMLDGFGIENLPAAVRALVEHVVHPKRQCEIAIVGKYTHVRDAYKDPRFSPEWDMISGYRTRSILAARQGRLVQSVPQGPKDLVPRLAAALQLLEAGERPLGRGTLHGPRRC